MDKSEFITKYNPYNYNGSDKEYVNFVKELNQLINSVKEGCAKIVNDKITGDLTPNEEHLLIEILTARRSE